MTRRHFIASLFRASISAAAFRPVSTSARPVDDLSMPIYDYGKGPTLKELSKKKLHHAKDGFRNPFGFDRHGRFRQVLRWKFFSKNRFKPYYDQESINPVKVDWTAVERHRGVSVTFLKHASVLVRDRDDYILVDPVFSDIFWFIKDYTPLGFPVNRIPAPKHVLITHGHYDHLDKGSLGRLNASSHVITPLGYNGVFEALPLKRRTTLDWFESVKEGSREISLLPCHHWTMRNPVKGPNTSLWGAYLIRTAAGPSIFISGDTAYFEGFKEIGERYSIELAVLNLGAYEPRWFMKNSHMNPAETVRAVQDLKAEKAMIVHWGTFRLGDEPVHFPPLQFEGEAKSAGIENRWANIRHGETFFF